MRTKTGLLVVVIALIWVIMGCASSKVTQNEPPKNYDLVDGNLVIRDGVTSISDGAFVDNQLTSVTIPDSVTSIGFEAFANNPSLTSITIGNGVGSLNENVFTGSLRNVTRISIGTNVNLRGSSDVVWSGFRGFYELNGNRAGTYTLSNGRWSAVYR
jgi:hypothetical protein